MRWNVEYEWHNFCAPREEGSVSQYNKVMVGSFLCDGQPWRQPIKPPVDSSPELFGQPTDSVHQLRQDKRVFILAIAAVLSALPLHILVVFSDKSGPSTVSLRGLQCRGWGDAGKLGQRKKDWWVSWVERQRNADDEVGSLCVELLLMLFSQFFRYKLVLWS